MTEGCEGEVCGNEDCPCAMCHGDPKLHLGGISSGIIVKDEDGNATGEIQCPYCFEIS